MSVRKVQLPNGKSRWEVCILSSGRNSRMLRRRFDTKVDAEHFEAQYKLDREKRLSSDGEVQSFEDTTFQAEAEFWLRKKQIEFSPSHNMRAAAILKSLYPRFGSLTPNRITASRLSDLQDDLYARKLKPTTIKRVTDCVRAVLNFSAEMRRIPYNPVVGFKPLKAQKKNVNFWEESEVLEFLAFSDKKYPYGSKKRWVHLVYLVALNTGMRAGEIVGLQVRNLVRDANLIRVAGQFDRVAQCFRETKTGRERLAPCNPGLRAELEAWIAQQGLKSHDYVFRSSDGTPLDFNNLRSRYFQKDMREAGMRTIRFHDMRHSAATLMIAKGLDLATVREILGHSSIETTQIYVHVLGDAVKRAAAVFAVGPTCAEAQSSAPIRGHLSLVKTG